MSIPELSPAAANASFRLDGQVAVVTGSSSGIGRAIAVELAAAGADVFVHARQNQAGAETTCEQIRRFGRSASHSLADVSAPGECERLFQSAWDWQGKVDIWVNNAGADVLTGPAAGWSFEQKLAKLWEVDVLSTVRLSRLVGEVMFARKSGVILNLGWDQAERGMAGDAGEMFGTIKGAVIAFSRSLAQTLAPHVRVHCLAPGWIRTAWGEQASAYWDQRAKQESLLHRWGTPEDVAQTARYLSSPAASFLTGQVVPINGGFRFGLPPAE